MTELSDHLQRMHLDAGCPTTREIARMSGVSHSTVAVAISGKHTPSWNKVVRIAQVLAPDASLERTNELWKRTKLQGRTLKAVTADQGEPVAWSRVQWGGAVEPDAIEPTHVSTYRGILESAMRPRWYRAVLYGPGRSVATPWVELEGSE